VKCEACHDQRKAGSTTAFVYRNGRVKCQACHDNHHERQGGDIWKEAGTGGGI